MKNNVSKVTKKEHLNDLVDLLALCANMPEEDFEGFDFENLTAYCQNEISLLEKKAAKAKASAAAKKAEKDELCLIVESVLTDEFQTRDEVTNQIEGEDITVAKVGNRLSKLVALGAAEKGLVSIPGVDGQKARKLTAYRLADSTNSEVE